MRKVLIWLLVGMIFLISLNTVNSSSLTCSAILGHGFWIAHCYDSNCFDCNPETASHRCELNPPSFGCGIREDGRTFPDGADWTIREDRGQCTYCPGWTCQTQYRNPSCGEDGLGYRERRSPSSCSTNTCNSCIYGGWVTVRYDSWDEKCFIPTEPTVNITPNPATIFHNLTCNVILESKGYNDETDTITYKYEWYKQDLLIESTNFISDRNHTLISNIAPCEEWTCKVIPQQDYGVNGTSGQDSLIVRDIPTEPTVNITPNPATTLNDIICRVTQESEICNDDSNIISYKYNWYKQDQLFHSTDFILDRNNKLNSNMNPFDEWVCEVIPQAYGVNGTSGQDSLVVQPHGECHLVELDCTAEFSDPDGDMLSLTYNWYKVNMNDGDLIFYSNNNSIIVPYFDEIIYVCEVYAYDGIQKSLPARKPVNILSNKAYIPYGSIDAEIKRFGNYEGRDRIPLEISARYGDQIPYDVKVFCYGGECGDYDLIINYENSYLNLIYKNSLDSLFNFRPRTGGTITSINSDIISNIHWSGNATVYPLYILSQEEKLGVDYLVSVSVISEIVYFDGSRKNVTTKSLNLNRNVKEVIFHTTARIVDNYQYLPSYYVDALRYSEFITGNSSVINSIQGNNIFSITGQGITNVTIDVEFDDIMRGIEYNDANTREVIQITVDYDCPTSISVTPSLINVAINNASRYLPRELQSDISRISGTSDKSNKHVSYEFVTSDFEDYLRSQGISEEEIITRLNLFFNYLNISKKDDLKYEISLTNIFDSDIFYDLFEGTDKNFVEQRINFTYNDGFCPIVHNTMKLKFNDTQEDIVCYYDFMHGSSHTFHYLNEGIHEIKVVEICEDQITHLIGHSGYLIDYDLGDGLVSYWNFENDFDDVYGGYVAENHGATIIEGKFGNAVSFNGIDQFIDYGTYIPGDEIKTISFWVKFNDIVKFQQIVSKSSHSRGVEVLLYYPGALNGISYYLMSNGDTKFIREILQSDFDISKWYHVVATHEGQGGNTMTLYLNGEKWGSGFTPSIISDICDGPDRCRFGKPSPLRLLFGSWNTDWNNLDSGTGGQGPRYFDGFLDEVAIWNRALLEQEVEILYNNYLGLLNDYGDGFTISSNLMNSFGPNIVPKQNISLKLMTGNSQGMIYHEFSEYDCSNSILTQNQNGVYSTPCVHLGNFGDRTLDVFVNGKPTDLVYTLSGVCAYDSVEIRDEVLVANNKNYFNSSSILINNNFRIQEIFSKCKEDLTVSCQDRDITTSNLISKININFDEDKISLEKKEDYIQGRVNACSMPSDDSKTEISINFDASGISYCNNDLSNTFDFYLPHSHSRRQTCSYFSNDENAFRDFLQNHMIYEANKMNEGSAVAHNSTNEMVDVIDNILKKGSSKSFMDWFMNYFMTYIIEGRESGYSNFVESYDICDVPVYICNCDQLQKINQNLGETYFLLNDIDCKDYSGFVPIGNFANPFTGKLYGMNYSIRNLAIQSEESHSGLFGRVSGGQIYDISVVDSKVNSSGMNIGGIVGSMYEGRIQNSKFVGNLSSFDTKTGLKVVGGIAGGCGRCQIINSSSIVSILESRSTARVGGLIGWTLEGSVLSSFSYSNITSLGSNQQSTGGLIGQIFYAELNESYSSGNVFGDIDVGGGIGTAWSSKIYNSYSLSNVTGNTNVGGFVGGNLFSSFVFNSYSTGSVIGNNYAGGFVGRSSGSGFNSFWDVDSSGKSNSALGIGKSTQEMFDQNTYTNWDFENIWEIMPESYPNLQQNHDFSHDFEFPKYSLGIPNSCGNLDFESLVDDFLATDLYKEVFPEIGDNLYTKEKFHPFMIKLAYFYNLSNANNKSELLDSDYLEEQFYNFIYPCMNSKLEHVCNLEVEKIFEDTPYLFDSASTLCVNSLIHLLFNPGMYFENTTDISGEYAHHVSCPLDYDKIDRVCCSNPYDNVYEGVCYPENNQNNHDLDGLIERNLRLSGWVEISLGADFGCNVFDYVMCAERGDNYLPLGTKLGGITPYSENEGMDRTFEFCAVYGDFNNMGFEFKSFNSLSLLKNSTQLPAEDFRKINLGAGLQHYDLNCNADELFTERLNDSREYVEDGVELIKGHLDLSLYRENDKLFNVIDRISNIDNFDIITKTSDDQYHGGILAGVVFDSVSGRPVPNVWVTLHFENPKGVIEPYASIITDSNGFYTTLDYVRNITTYHATYENVDRIPLTNYVITAKHPSYEDFIGDNPVTVKNLNEYDIYLHPFGICEPDCTFQGSNLCREACDGINGCVFPRLSFDEDFSIKSLLDMRASGSRVDFQYIGEVEEFNNTNYRVVACVGSPTIIENIDLKQRSVKCPAGQNAWKTERVVRLNGQLVTLEILYCE